MNLRLAAPGQLVDITRAPDLAGCGANGGGLHIGAGARQRAVELHADTLAVAPVLAHAISNAGQVPVRHQGTVVGSIAHADPSAEMPAAFKAPGRDRHRPGRRRDAPDRLGGLLRGLLHDGTGGGRAGHGP